MTNYKIETMAIHAGHIKNEHGALSTPLYQTSTFIFDSAAQGGRRFAGDEEGYIYTRLGNPTTNELEQRMAALEGYEAAAACATGMGAISAAIMANVSAGDHIISSNAVYGCTFALLSHMLKKFGVQTTFVDMTDHAAVEAALQENTKVIFFETPINPNMVVLDIEFLANFAKKNDILSIADNTFLTPILQRPIEYGVDIVVHSATKYLNGHGDVVAGIICSDAEMIMNIKMTSLKDIGATISPHDAWLIIRGLKTLHIRMERHCDNALKIAKFLEAHPDVERVDYPGLESHAGYKFIGKQMKAAGGVIAFELKKKQVVDGQKFIDACDLFSLAVSLGDAESLIQHPASMTHSPYEEEERLAAGISNTLIRISVGLENVDDLITDLDQAFKA